MKQFHPGKGVVECVCCGAARVAAAGFARSAGNREGNFNFTERAITTRAT